MDSEYSVIERLAYRANRTLDHFTWFLGRIPRTFVRRDVWLREESARTSVANTDFYLDTSAINWFSSRYGSTDATVTKQLHLKNRNRFWLSPVNVLEILLTKDNEKREKLIFYCQHMFQQYILQSPSELIIDYLKEGCPQKQWRGRNWTSRTDFGITWRNISRDPRRTFVYEQASLLSMVSILRKVSLMLRRVYASESFVERQSDGLEFGLAYFTSQVLSELSNDKDLLKEERAGYLFLVMFLVLKLDIEQQCQDEYWASVGVKSDVDKFVYLATECRTALRRGPVAMMSKLAIAGAVRLNAPINRGFLLDCMHTIYLYPMHVFMTADGGFLRLREVLVEDGFPYFAERILHMDEALISTRKRFVE